MSRSPEITGSLTDISQPHFQDLSIGAHHHILAENFYYEPNCLLYVSQSFLFRLALTYGTRQFEASNRETSLVLRFEDDCVFHSDNS